MVVIYHQNKTPISYLLLLSVLLILFNRISKHDSKDVKIYPYYQKKKKNVKVFYNYKRVQHFHLERAFPINMCETKT